MNEIVPQLKQIKLMDNQEILRNLSKVHPIKAVSDLSCRLSVTHLQMVKSKDNILVSQAAWFTHKATGKLGTLQAIHTLHMAKVARSINSVSLRRGCYRADADTPNQKTKTTVINDTHTYMPFLRAISRQQLNTDTPVGVEEIMTARNGHVIGVVANLDGRRILDDVLAGK